MGEGDWARRGGGGLIGEGACEVGGVQGTSMGKGVGKRMGTGVVGGGGAFSIT